MNELEKWQDKTALPGMWPTRVDSSRYNESILLDSPYVRLEETFTLGPPADSAYEYLPKVSFFQICIPIFVDTNSNSCSSVDR